MKVILLQDIENLGSKYDVKDVADGHARNFLLPQKLAKVATPSALKELEQLKKRLEAEAEAALKRAEELTGKLDGYELRITEKVNEAAIFFGAITAAMLATELKANGFDLTKEQITLEEPIKEPGEYDVVLNLEHGLEARIKVIAEAAAVD
ncbi:50S ribosomal protein L9 [Candidatus Parcubacteria bacterium]|nr:50S ribosomal protein L9 [Candidatus Parcubacteria bacterium]